MRDAVGEKRPRSSFSMRWTLLSANTPASDLWLLHVEALLALVDLDVRRSSQTRLAGRPFGARGTVGEPRDGLRGLELELVGLGSPNAADHRRLEFH